MMMGKLTFVGTPTFTSQGTSNITSLPGSSDGLSVAASVSKERHANSAL
jgi:hypothetical protein